MAATQRDKSELIAGLETAVSTSPDNVELRLLLVGHLVEGGHCADALTHVTTVIQAQPDRVEAHRWAAQAAHAVGDPRAGAFERVVRALTALDAANEATTRASATSAAPRPAARPVPASAPAEATTARASLGTEPAPAAPAAEPRPHVPVAADPFHEVASEMVAPRASATTETPVARAVPPAGPMRPTAVADAPVVTRRFVSEEVAPGDDALAESEPPSVSDPIPSMPIGPRSRFGRRNRVTAKRPADAEVLEPSPEAATVAESPEPEDEAPVSADIAAEVVAPDVPETADDAEDEVWEAPAERFVIAPEDVEHPRLTLADIATDTVRDRFEAILINPLRNGGGARKARQGGLLLFGPGGCGKGFFARIVAGELRAGFLRVDMAESMQWPGDPRENIDTIFETARAAGPCVLYLDNIDRAGIHPDTPQDAADRRLLSRLASEISNASSSKGLFVFGATTAPWQVDMTLLSNGRLDRSLVVLPPDAAAREAILRRNLGDVPLSGVDLPWIIERTRHFSADDLVSLTDRAKALAAINALGDQIVVGPGEMTRAFREVRPAAPSWFTNVHENAVGGGSQEGMYDEVMSYMNANQLV